MMRMWTRLAGIGVVVLTAGVLLVPTAGAGQITPVRSVHQGGCHLYGPPGGPYLITCRTRPGGAVKQAPLKSGEQSGSQKAVSQGGGFQSGSQKAVAEQSGSKKKAAPKRGKHRWHPKKGPGCHLSGPPGGPYLITCHIGPIRRAH